MTGDGGAPPLLRLDGLRVTHLDARRATPDRVSLRVDRGEVVLLLGPSGCGKSTLALAAAGLVPRAVDAAVEGRIELGGADATAFGPGEAAAHVGIVFQDADAQLVTSTVDDEVAFGPENLALPLPDIARRVDGALAAVGLLDRRADAPETLSGGGRQRLAIAAALALDAPLLVLDEPTANLDPAGRREVYDALAPLVEAGTHGILLIEHNLDEALRIATRVVALDAHGRVIADGPPHVVFRDHADALARDGVWLPLGVAGARALRIAGVEVPGSPLTAAELIEAVSQRITARSEGSAPSQADRAAAAGRAADVAGATATGPLSTVAAASGAISRTDAARGGGANAADAVLIADRLTVRAGGRRILDDVTLRIPRGSFTAVVGQNGAGKSTLLQHLAGVVRPPRGTVRLDGDDVARLSPKRLRSRVGVVFQNPEHQFLRQRVRDELELGLDASDPGVAARVDDLLDRFGLAEQADTHPFLLSGGQKRRLSVGTALVENAGVLLLDEPTYGQDQARADELLALLESLRADGATIVMATHDLQLVSEHATHLVVLEAGHVAAAGDAGDVLRDGAFERAGLGLPPLARALAAARSPLRDRVPRGRLGEFVAAVVEAAS